jgi:hypothetical protein
MAVETMIVAIAAPVLQHEIAVFLGQKDISVGVETHDDRLRHVVARVTGHSRSVAARANQFSGGHPDSCGIGEVRGGGRDRCERNRAPPKLKNERGGQAEEDNRNASQREGLFCRRVHLLQPQSARSCLWWLTARCSMLHLFLLWMRQRMESRLVCRKRRCLVSRLL